MSDSPDYIQTPVDAAYERGVHSMGRGRPVSAGEWLEAIARMFASGLAMRGGVGKPGFSEAQRETVLRDLKNAMGRLLRGNMPPREPDPRIIRQFEAGRQLPAGRHPERTVEHGWPSSVPRVASEAGQDIQEAQPILRMKSEMYTPPTMPYAAYSQLIRDLRDRGTWP